MPQDVSFRSILTRRLLKQYGIVKDITGIAAIDLLNADPLLARNAANTANVNLIQNNASDQIVVGTNVLVDELSFSQIILAADAANRVVFTAKKAVQITQVTEDHSVVGGAAAALMVEKLTGTTAPGSGTNILTGTISLTATINTAVNGTLSATVATLQMAAGDRLGFVLTGTLTGLVGAVTITYKYI